MARIVKAMVFPVVMYGCESWTIKKAEKNRCFWTLVLKKTLESPLGCKDIKLVNTKGNQCWIFTGRTDAEAAAPIFWPPDVKMEMERVIGNDSDAGKDGRQEETGMTKDERVGWHHWLNGHEFEQTLGDTEGQGSLARYSHGGVSAGHDLATEQWQHLVSTL